MNHQYAKELADAANRADTKAFLDTLELYAERGLLPRLSPEAQLRVLEYSLKQAGHDPANLPSPSPRSAAASRSRQIPTPQQRIPPRDAPVGEVYLVDGKEPIPLDLRSGAWRQRFNKDGDLTYTVRGVYIARDGETGQLYKVGDTNHIPTRVTSDGEASYQHWVTDHGIPLILDFYHLPGMQKTGRVETALKNFLEGRGWDLPVHFENAYRTNEGYRIGIRG